MQLGLIYLSSNAAKFVVKGRVLDIFKKEVTPPLAQAGLAVVKSSLCSNPGSGKSTWRSITPRNQVNPDAPIAFSVALGSISGAICTIFPSFYP